MVPEQRPCCTSLPSGSALTNGFAHVAEPIGSSVHFQRRSLPSLSRIWYESTSPGTANPTPSGVAPVSRAKPAVVGAVGYDVEIERVRSTRVAVALRYLQREITRLAGELDGAARVALAEALADGERRLVGAKETHAP
jgi:hypothetical protein